MRTVEIPLTQGLVALVDESDAEVVLGHRWHAVVARHTFYAARKDAGRTQYLHRLLLGIRDRAVFSDHRDGDGLNNRRLNLRVSSPAQNSRNRRPSVRDSGLPMGVWRARDKFAARVVCDGSDHYLGVFQTPEEAGQAYIEAARRVFGNFAPRVA